MNCPDCGGALGQAFATTKNYVCCTRCGHVFPADLLTGTSEN